MTSACTHEPETYIGHNDLGGHQWNCSCGSTLVGPEPERDDIQNAVAHHERAASVFRNMRANGAPEWVALLVEQSLAKAAALRELLACPRCNDTGRVPHFCGPEEYETSCDCAAAEARDKREAERREDDQVAAWEAGA